MAKIEKDPKKEAVKEAAIVAPKPIEVEEEAPKPQSKVDSEFEVKDPQELRPIDLPLVVTPKSGNWKNGAQETLARVINAYAYKNPEKFEIKKEVLLKQLKELGSNPALLNKLQGGKSKGKLAYSNKAVPLEEVE